MKYLQQKKKTRQIIFFFFFAILANFYERAWLPKTLDLILIFGMLGLLHGSFLLIFGQEMSKDICLVIVRFIGRKSKVGITAKKNFCI